MENSTIAHISYILPFFLFHKTKCFLPPIITISWEISERPLLQEQENKNSQ